MAATSQLSCDLDSAHDPPNLRSSRDNSPFARLDRHGYRGRARRPVRVHACADARIARRCLDCRHESRASQRVRGGHRRPDPAVLARGADGTTLVRSDNEGWFYNDAVAISGEPLAALLDRLDVARSQQIEIVRSFTSADWDRPLSPVFASGSERRGLRSPAWIAMKSFQHTWEHGNAILRAMLFSPRA